MAEVILGVSGYAGAGKDTLADLLVTHFSFTKLAFADPMRGMAAAIDPVVGYGDGNEPIRYSDALEWHGYTEAKVIYPEIRVFLQRLGTEAGRNVLGQNVWVDAGMRRAQDHGRVVFADLRFHNEAEAIKAAGGFAIRVERPGVEPPNGHPSEHDLDGWPFDLHVNNNGAVSDMLPRLDGFFARHLPRVMRNS